MAWFIVYMKTINSKWPLELFATNNLVEKQLTSLDDIKQQLLAEGKIFYRDANKHEETIRKTLYKSQITSISGPVHIPNSREILLTDVLTLNEAAEEWMNISKVDTIRKAILSGRFYEWEVRKSAAIWLVTRNGMTRLFGPADEYKYPSLIVQQLIYNDGDPYWKPIL